jgi:hypothetical protein
MESQPPPVPCPATCTQQHHHSQPQLSPNALPAEYEYTCNEKAPSQRQQSIRVERNSKSSYGRGHDSVISHPFSPKASSPPSPCSSVSSIGRPRHSVQETRRSRSEIEQQIQLPPKAHLDPEKHGLGSSRGHRSPNRVSAAGPDGDAIVYDKGEYQEKQPEERAWHLLVSDTNSINLTVVSNIHPVLALRPLCFPLRRHRPMDRLRAPDIARTSTPALLHHTPFALRTNHRLPRPSAKLATASYLLSRLNDRLQCLHARCRASFLTHCRIRCCGSCVDCGGLLVLLVDTR